ncbi:uncharacterized protein LOC128234621 [Mya arenaria]|uniref:uncharacterized protein LOC128234621 n=1 Tax=Mya arenaria TaxID=6604 RepID=UPI0022E2A532|nr:uncharacterized protein LOC128234621 [Mya arenaria]
MEEELEELESILSEHFGRTPHGSQELEEDDQDLCEPPDNAEAGPLVQTRMREIVLSLNSESGKSSDECTYDSDCQDYLNTKRFMEDCGCKKQYQSNFTLDEAYNIVLKSKEKSKEEKGLFIMGVLSAEKYDSVKTKRGKKRVHARTKFYVNSSAVCRQTFQLIYDVKRTTLNNIIQNMKDTRTGPRVHRNTGRRLKHALNFDDVQRVV